jgi:acetyl esterase/lipase
MQYLAARGWVCFGIDYRLSPRATFPDHLVDVKRAIRWVREEGAQYGADPAFLVVAGGSAGGHLAALAALTAGDTLYQPGFETVDTSVAGCIGFYGVYDFMDRYGHWPSDGLQRLLERYVMKSRRDEDPLAWERASPMSRVHAEAPPFFLVHGDCDNLVPVAEARRFAETLRTSSQAPVVYAEIPGGHHAFEVFPSPRSELVLRGIGRFGDWLYSRYLARQAVRSASG